VDLRDHRLRRAPHAHELLGRRALRRGGEREVAARVPLPVGRDLLVPRLEAAAEVVAGAERAPAPRSTITRTARSATACPTAASTSSGSGGTIVLSCSGRFSVIVATGPSTA
jgi:hypothetical protein